MSSDSEDIERPRKKVKGDKTNRENAQEKDNRRLFAPFRALGFVTNHIPFSMQVRSYKGATGAPRVHILTCLGRAWAEFEGEKMKLLFVGPDAPDPITSMILDRNYVWITAGSTIVQYEAGKEISQLHSPIDGNLTSLLAFGSQLLVLDEAGRHLLVWDTTTRQLASTIIFEEGFTASKIIHPPTLLNKVLISSVEGTLQVWNIRTRTLIYTFKNLRNGLTKPSSITALVQSHVADVVAVGFGDGFVSVHDIKDDEQIMRVRMDGGNITSIAFRTDGQEMLATSNSVGHIALWDLNESGRLLHIIRGAHDGSASCIQWIPGQPILVSSGDDNSLKQWIFDSPDVPPRLLKFRSGHRSPPHLIRHYGEDGKQILTAAHDRSLRCTSVVRDSRSFELSQGSLSKKATSFSIPITSLKFPPITALSFSHARSRDWDDVLTGHAEESFARTWSVGNKKLGKFSFPTMDESSKNGAIASRGVVKAVHVTACGNFGLAAGSTGTIQLWSMQSGLKRKSFVLGPAPEEVDTRFQLSAGGTSKGGKGRSVTGLATDALNKVLVVGTLDGTLNFFNFHNKQLEETQVFPSSIVSLLLHTESNLLAVICDDLVVRMFDLETRRLVREFSGFKGRILDIAFSHDSRWLIVTSLDSVIRTFDIPSGQLIDAFRTPTIANSVSFSPTGDFLATSHVDSVGIYLWANRAQYTEVSWRSSREVEQDIQQDAPMPSLQGTEEEEALEGLKNLGVIESMDIFKRPQEIKGDLIELTLLPRARWQTLLHLDTISQRNKAKEPVKAPEKAPFFLPSLPGENITWNTETLQEESQHSTKGNSATNRLEKNRAMALESIFQRILRENEEKDYESLFALLKDLSPPAIDLELRLLITSQQQITFLNALKARLLSHRDFEMVQTLMAVFLRMHGEQLAENEEILEHLQELLVVTRAESNRLDALVTRSMGMLGFIRDL